MTEEREITIYKDLFNIKNLHSSKSGKTVPLKDPAFIEQRKERNNLIKPFIPNIMSLDIQDLLDNQLTKVWQCNNCERIGMTFLTCQEIRGLADNDGNKIYFTTYKNEKNSIVKGDACKNHRNPVSKGKRAGRTIRTRTSKMRKIFHYQTPSPPPSSHPSGSDDEELPNEPTRPFKLFVFPTEDPLNHSKFGNNLLSDSRVSEKWTLNHYSKCPVLTLKNIPMLKEKSELEKERL